jgi:hypothetical protein
MRSINSRVFDQDDAEPEPSSQHEISDATGGIRAGPPWLG